MLQMSGRFSTAGSKPTFFQQTFSDPIFDQLSLCKYYLYFVKLYTFNYTINIIRYLFVVYSW